MPHSNPESDQKLITDYYRIAENTTMIQRKGILRPDQDMGNYVGQSVINLSDYNLSQKEIEILSKGLNYCPKPKEVEMHKIIASCERLFRNMRYKYFFEKRAENMLRQKLEAGEVDITPPR